MAGRVVVAVLGVQGGFRMSHLLKKIPYPIYRIVQPLMTRIRDRRARRLYASFAKKGDLCFDVGANIGDRLEILLQLGCKVVAVEPQSSLMEIVKRRFEGNSKAILVQAALGGQEGRSEIMISDSHTLSSMSGKWIEAVRGSGRFGATTWSGRQEVRVTTLDVLIREYGVPAFVKIDVEGYEYEVIQGLSRPVPAISFEFVPEYIDVPFLCIDHLQKIGKVEFNYSLFEEMKLKSRDWVPADSLKKLLSVYKDPVVFGDIYARFC